MRTASTQSRPSLPAVLAVNLSPAACLSDLSRLSIFSTLADFCLFFFSSFLLNSSSSHLLGSGILQFQLHTADPPPK